MPENVLNLGLSLIGALIAAGGMVWRLAQALPSQKDVDALETRLNADMCALEARITEKFASKDSIKHLEQLLADIRDELRYLRQRLDARGPTQ